MSRRRAAVLTALVALAVAGCGDDDEALPAACSDGAETFLAALRAAPQAVRLQDGTPISTCVERARSNADLQNMGTVLTQAADRLSEAAARSDAAATQLGYLIGAIRRGGAHTNGIHDELIRRIQQTTGLGGAPPARRPAFERGE